MGSMSVGLYNQLIQVSTEYLGPAAERFVSRQITSHLNKAPEEVSKEDLPKLVDWMKVSVATLTGDKLVADTFTRKILDLSK